MNEDTESKERRGWHLDKRFSISHAFTTLAIITGVMAWGSTLESRTAVIEKTSVIQNVNTQQQLTDIKSLLIRMDEKLDRKADR